MHAARAIPSGAAAEAASARVLEPGALPAQLRFSTDTRSLCEGDAFVALQGERFDGHAYVAEALARGAVALVVADPSVVPAGVPALVVRDTTQAYLDFGAVARRAARAHFVAITGSTGKTTTKTFLAHLLEQTQSGRVVATPANENNAIGVAKLLLGLPEDAAFVVVEFGARHFGEIEPLARGALPEVALVTNIGEAHLEIMGSRERLAQTKWGIFSTGARPVLFADDAPSRARAASLPCPRTWFSAGGRALPADDGDDVNVALVRSGAADELRVSAGRGAAPGERRYPTCLAIPGAHNRANAAAAAAAALALGALPGAIAAALPSLALPAGRYERMALHGFDVIYDAYNASASGMLATLASFAGERAQRRIAVLGSMAELGEDAAEWHARVGEAAARSRLDVLLVGGDYAGDLERGARAGGLEAGRIVPFASNDVAATWLREHARAGDLVLLKASRRYKLEEVLEALHA